MESGTDKIIQSLQKVDFEGILEEIPIDFNVEYTKVDDPGDSYNFWSIKNGILNVKIYDTHVNHGIETFIGTIVKSSMRNVVVTLGWLIFELITIVLLMVSILSHILLIITAIIVIIYSVFELRYKKLRKELYRKKLLKTNIFKTKSKLEKTVNLFTGNIYASFYCKLTLKLLILFLWALLYIGTLFFGLI